MIFISCFKPNKVIVTSLKTFFFGRLEDIPDFLIDPETGEYCEPISVPCGQCIGCRLDYAAGWADRLCLEASLYDEELSHFITLTYDTEHVPINESKTGFTLLPDDVTLFMKRLREHYRREYNDVNIRFYLAGEYGTDTMRPHYHLCIFNIEIPDLQYYSKNKQGDLLYMSDLLNSIWGKGNVIIGSFCWQTAAYTARYVVKKLKGEQKSFYGEFDIQSEFVRMSRRPGIASKFFENNYEELLNTDTIYLPKGKSVRSVRLPRYFLNKVDSAQDPERFIDNSDNYHSFLSDFNLAKLKERRKHILDVKNSLFNQLTDEQQIKTLRKQEELKNNRVSLLTKNNIFDII